jgi:replicative DNA helicase
MVVNVRFYIPPGFQRQDSAGAAPAQAGKGGCSMSAPLGRKLPYSINAEMLFLGTQLMLPECKLGNGLKHQHFFIKQHGYLFAAIREAQAAGINFDAIAAEQWVANDDRFLDVGGKDYIAKLLEFAEAPINAEERAHLIMDYAAKRELVFIAENLDTSAHNADVCESADVLKSRHRDTRSAVHVIQAGVFIAR